MNKIAIIGLSGNSVFMEVDHFHNPGETINALSFHQEPGGKGYNQAIACASFGGMVSYLSAVGNDEAGCKVTEFMKNKKFLYPINDFFCIKEGQTTYANILTNNQGENQVTVYSKVNLDEADLEKFLITIKNSDVLLLQLEVPFIILEKAINFAYLNNVKVILNPAPMTKKLSDELLNKIYLLTPNEFEFRQLFGVDNNIKYQEFGDYLKKSNCQKNLIITLGENGVLAYINHQYQYFPANKVSTVDTTGAGDIFNGALALKIANNENINEAILYAMQKASHSVTKKYVMGAIE